MIRSIVSDTYNENIKKNGVIKQVQKLREIPGQRSDMKTCLEVVVAAQFLSNFIIREIFLISRKTPVCLQG